MIAAEEINKEIIENHKDKIMIQGLMDLVLKDQDRRDKIQTDLALKEIIQMDQDRRDKIQTDLVLKDHALRVTIQTGLVLKDQDHRDKIQTDRALKDQGRRDNIQTGLVLKEIIQMDLDLKVTITHKKKTSNIEVFFLCLNLF
jgi:hypothetical protein